MKKEEKEELIFTEKLTDIDLTVLLDYWADVNGKNLEGFYSVTDNKEVKKAVNKILKILK